MAALARSPCWGRFVCARFLKIAKIGAPYSAEPIPDMPDNAKQAFDAKEFLAKVGEGRRYSSLARARLSSPKEMRPTPFTISKRAGSKSLSYLSKGRKR